MRRKSINSSIFFLFFLYFTSTVSIILITLDPNRPIDYQRLPLLPLVFLILIIVFFQLITLIEKYTSVLILVGLYFVRMVIHPVTLTMSNYATFNNGTTMDIFFNKGSSLLIYESILVFSFLYINYFKLKNKNVEIEFSEKKMNGKINKYLLDSILLLFILLIAVVFIIFPQIRHHFTIGLPSSSANEILRNNINIANMQSSIPGPILSVSIYIIALLKFILPIYLFDFILKHFHKKNVVITLTIVLIILTTMVNIPQRSYSIIIAIALLFSLAKIYPKKMKQIYVFIFLSVFVFVLGDLFLRSDTDISAFISEISVTINAYFGASQNIAQSFVIPFSFSNIRFLINDFLGSIPFTSSIFGDLTTTTEYFNYSIYGHYNRADQIIPMIGSARVYFSSIFAPLPIILIINYALKIEMSFNKDVNIFQVYLRYLTVIILVISVATYNFEILYTTLLRINAPLYLIFYVTKKKRVFKKNDMRTLSIVK